MLRAAFAFLTTVAIGFSIWVQQMTPMMVRAENFERFRDRVSDGDRDAILGSAAAAVWLAIVPLIITNVAWMAIGCGNQLLLSKPRQAKPPEST